jgi:hypothetical protein
MWRLFLGTITRPSILRSPADTRWTSVVSFLAINLSLNLPTLWQISNNYRPYANFHSKRLLREAWNTGIPWFRDYLLLKSAPAVDFEVLVARRRDSFRRHGLATLRSGDSRIVVQNRRR